MDDLVKGTILSAESRTAEGEIFYLSDGMIYSNEEITEAIAFTLGSKPIRLRIPGSLMPIIASIGQKLGNQSNIINKDKIRELQHSYWTCDSTKSKKRTWLHP